MDPENLENPQVLVGMMMLLNWRCHYPNYLEWFFVELAVAFLKHFLKMLGDLFPSKIILLFLFLLRMRNCGPSSPFLMVWLEQVPLFSRTYADCEV